MNSLQSEFIEFNLAKFGYTSTKDLIENFYLKAIGDSYQRVNKTISIENDIRDRFIYDFYHVSPILKNWLQLKILHVNWERWVFKNDNELGRADLSFELPGFDFIIECKKLKDDSPKYVNDGLKRFVDLEYAKKDEYAGMIGFIISGKTEIIISKLQTKCKAFNYSENEFCEQRLNNCKNSFNSCHIRSDDSEIKIYHLFFDFKFEKSTL
jgi:hypothetical protein